MRLRKYQIGLDVSFMKICLVGSKMRVVTFANQLAERGVEVHIIPNRVISNGSMGWIDPRIRCHEEFVNKLKFESLAHIFQYPFTILRFRKKIREINPDIVHAFFIIIYGWIVSFCNFHPFVLTTMGSDINVEQGAFKTIPRRILSPAALRMADLVTVQSQEGYDQVKIQTPDKKVIFFRAGFDWRKFYDDKKPVGLANQLKVQNDFVILSPRGFNKVFYNIEVIVKGFKKLLESVGNCKLLLIGKSDNDYAKRIRNLVEELEIQDYVIFVGRIPHDEIKNYYNLCDVAVSLPDTDGSPASVVEILACGKPILAGRNNSIEELITDGSNGFIIDPHDDNALFQRLVNLHSNQGLYTQMADNALKDIGKHASQEYCNKMVKEYERFLS
jgi:L-malate glycosyltransferase